MVQTSFAIGREVIEIIESNQHEAYFVGGSVRDLLLNRPIEDIDIATSALPEEVILMFDKVIPVGLEHGTVIVRHKKQSFEVTTYRHIDIHSHENQADSKQFNEQIYLDLQRRDFTINALAMDKTGEIIDCFSSKQDLKRQVIRAVGNGLDRFTEDPLRIFRALRFCSELGFKIEEATFNSMNEVTSQIPLIAIERITNELTKQFAGDNVKDSLIYFRELKLAKHLPIFKDNLHLLTKLPERLIPLESFGEVVSLFYYLDQSIPILSWVKEWKCSNRIKRQIINLTNALDYFTKNKVDNWFIYNLANENLAGFIRLATILFPKENLTLDSLLQMKKELSIHRTAELAITGNDLLKLYPDLKRGPWIGDLIKQLERKVVFKELPNNKLKLKEWIMCQPPEKS